MDGLTRKAVIQMGITYRELLPNLPEEVQSVLEALNVAERRLESQYQEDRKGKEKVLRKGETMSRYLGKMIPHVSVNVIPGGVPGECRLTLVVFIGDYDEDLVLENRVLEALKHVSVLCKGMTRYVIFYATWWSGLVWAKHSAPFKKVGATCILRIYHCPPLLL